MGPLARTIEHRSLKFGAIAERRWTLRVVLHADDLGLNSAINAGIVRGFERGLLTSTSLLANAPQAAAALASWQDLCRRHAEGVLPSVAARAELDDTRAAFDLGVHLNLTQGRPLSGQGYPAELLDEGGRFPGIAALFYRLQGRPARFGAGIRAELVEQITFVLDHGLRPTHLNSHQYVELLPPVAETIRRLIELFRIPVVRVAVEPALLRSTFLSDFRVAPLALALVKRFYAWRFRRGLAGHGVTFPPVYFGTSQAGRIDGRLMKLFLARAGRAECIEIGLHPGLPIDSADKSADADGWHDVLAPWRSHELKLLESRELVRLLKQSDRSLGRLSQLTAAGRGSQEFIPPTALPPRPLLPEPRRKAG